MLVVFDLLAAQGAFAADRPGPPAGRDTGAKEGLARIDIADPGDQPLVEKRRLDRAAPAGERRLERSGGEGVG